jgi:hypothetical protein
MPARSSGRLNASLPFALPGASWSAALSDEEAPGGRKGLQRRGHDGGEGSRVAEVPLAGVGEHLRLEGIRSRPLPDTVDAGVGEVLVRGVVLLGPVEEDDHLHATVRQFRLDVVQRLRGVLLHVVVGRHVDDHGPLPGGILAHRTEVQRRHGGEAGRRGRRRRGRRSRRNGRRSRGRCRRGGRIRRPEGDHGVRQGHPGRGPEALSTLRRVVQPDGVGPAGLQLLEPDLAPPRPRPRVPEFAAQRREVAAVAEEQGVRALVHVLAEVDSENAHVHGHSHGAVLGFRGDDGRGRRGGGSGQHEDRKQSERGGFHRGSLQPMILPQAGARSTRETDCRTGVPPAPRMDVAGRNGRV